MRCAGSFPAADKRPDFFIVGAPRCGTTALVEYLSWHPDIFMAKKEMHFFGGDLHFGAQFYRRDHKAYLAEFNDRNGEPRAGEASVWYLFSEQAAAEIKAFNAEARIIIMLRQPAEMLCALYNMFRCDGNEYLPAFEQALAAQVDRRSGRKIGRRTYLRQGLLYHEVARYTQQVRRYFDVFGRDRVRVVLFDDFAANTAGVYGEVLEFLGVDSTRIPESFPVVNGNVCASTVRLSWLRDLLCDPLLRGKVIAMNSLLPRPVFAALQRIELQLTQLNHRHVARPQLDPDLKARLCRDFAPEVDLLGKLLGRDLTHWKLETESANQTFQPVTPN